MIIPSAPPLRMSSVVGDYQKIERLVPYTTDITRVVDASPDRCVLAFFDNAAGTGCRLATTPASLPTYGFYASPDNQPLILTSRDHNALVWSEWYAAAGFGGTLFIIEIFYRPRG